MNKVLIVTFAALLLVGCGGRAQKKKETQTEAKKLEIIVPPVPGMLPENEQGVYLAKNYWRNFDFTDTAYVNQPDITEQAFANYINVLSYMPQFAGAFMNDLLTKAQADSTMYDYFVELAEKYLYEPNSPMRNEDIYISVAKSIVNSPMKTDLEKERYRRQSRLIAKNRVGDKAQNFSFKLRNGQVKSLYDVKTDYTILYFYNPGCSACASTIYEIRNSARLAGLERGDILTIVAVYPDEDLTLWKEHAGEIPKSWIDGYDFKMELKSKELYDLKAIPTLYLLDKNKKVVIKDAMSVAQIEDFYNKSPIW